MMWGYGWNLGGMWLFGVLTLVGIALVVVLLVRVFGGSMRGADPTQGADRTGESPPTPPTSNRARQILDERFAAGEITTDQYREQVRVLGEGR